MLSYEAMCPVENSVTIVVSKRQESMLKKLQFLYFVRVVEAVLLCLSQNRAYTRT